jgi:tetratricopeptide (TPR) repeat protein
MVDSVDRDPSDALKRASVFPTRIAPQVPGPPESERDPVPSSAFAGEDFLFHLYRGSELLQDNCVEQAKEELERALRLQPRDTEGQGLLGIVYFRLGMYPRAIGIYDDLIRAWPTEITPRVNLALCYLKTGQAHLAREALEEVIRREPEHRRAWGYYGLALERLGEYQKAQAAFERGGKPELARRMSGLVEAAEQASEPVEPSSRREEVRLAAADAVQELDDSGVEGSFTSAADPDPADLEPVRSARWRAHEPGEEPLPPRSRPARPPSGSVRITHLGASAHEALEVPPLSLRHAPPSVEASASSSLGSPSAYVADVAIAAPTATERYVLRGTVALVRVEVGFLVRNESLRAVQSDGAAFRSAAVRRRMRGRETDEPLGGAASPWSLLEGTGLVALSARAGRSLAAIELGGEFIYLRESRLLGFDLSARYENGRLPAPPQEPQPIVIVQLSGRGVALVESERPLRALEVQADRKLVVRSESVAGWTGRMLAQPLTAEQSPTHGHGFVAFAGEGAVLLDDA